MADLVTSLLTNSQTLLIVILFYFVALWLMFCLWVFVDAMRRYKNVFMAVIMTLLVFVFNFPVLIFYLIVRPEDDYAVVNDGTVNVPVANFIGEDGEVVMSLNLKINGQPSSNSDMNVNVDWKANGGDEVQSISRKVTFGGGATSAAEPNQKVNALKSRLESFRAKAENSLKQVVESKPLTEDYNQENEQEEKPNKAKSKKNR